MKKLNFGCGKNIRKEYINADLMDIDGVDINFNFNNFPYPFQNNEFDEILADNVLEHLDNIPAVMQELHRISKPDAMLRIIVPYYNCYGASNDVTHKHYFSHLSFEPFYKKNARANYGLREEFRLKSMKLIPTRLGRLLLFDSIRRPLSFIFGQIIQTIELEIIIRKY